MNRKKKNPWTSEDEREHQDSVLEWWATESFLKSTEDNKKWVLKGVFTEWFNTINDNGSILNLTLYDKVKDKHFNCYLRSDGKKLQTESNSFEVKYEDCFIMGAYPNYKMSVHDKENEIKVDINYHAEAMPHWVAQDITNGWLPMGAGFYRYGFIPKNHINGKIKIKDKTYKIEGKGYFEHVWGNFLYDNPLKNITGLKKTLPIYWRFILWWLENHRLKIPNSIKFATENNPFGYDWAWALFDNGWTIYYGNILFWMMEGPAVGTLIFSKDGEEYKEFCDITFHYNNTKLSKNYDFYYPTEFELTAQDKNEKIHLKFKMSTEAKEYVSRFQKNKYWLGFVICEAPGTVEGYYSNNKKTIKLKGIAKIEPQRQVSIIGHNSLKINIIKPPKGVGISFNFDSHFLKKNILAKIKLVPHPEIKFNCKNIC
jgi:hypothetical protein